MKTELKASYLEPPPHCLTLYTKINSKWVKDLAIRNKTIKSTAETIGDIFQNFKIRDAFGSSTIVPREIKARRN